MCNKHLWMENMIGHREKVVKTVLEVWGVFCNSVLVLVLTTTTTVLSGRFFLCVEKSKLICVCVCVRVIGFLVGVCAASRRPRATPSLFNLFMLCGCPCHGFCCCWVSLLGGDAGVMLERSFTIYQIHIFCPNPLLDGLDTQSNRTTLPYLLLLAVLCLMPWQRRRQSCCSVRQQTMINK